MLLVCNTLYLEKSIGGVVNEDLITHISPLGWEHNNMLGEYSYNFDNSKSTELTRQLNI